MILLMNVDKDNPSVAEGESVQIQGAGLTGFEPKGNTEQDSYTGNQLIDFNNMQLSEDTTFSFTNNIFTVSSTAGTYRSAYQFITDIFKNNPGKTLTFKEESYYVQTTAGNPAIQLRITYSDETPTRYTVIRNYQNNTTIPYTIPNDTSNIATVRVHAYTNNTNVERANILTITKPLLYFDNNDTYEPFVGGSPSPSPDYPQPIEVVTEDNTINIHGKNLYDKDSESIDIVINSSGIEITNSAFNTSDYISIKGNSSYNLSWESSSSYFQAFISYYDSNKTFIQRENITTSNTYTKAFTTLENAKYIRISYSKEVNETPTPRTNIQLELGSSASEYTPYVTPQEYPLNLGTIELCKIGTYQDYIYKENNKWYKHSEIGKVVLDGSEDWNYFGNMFYVDNLINDYLKENIITSICNQYKGSTNSATTQASYNNGNNTISFRTGDTLNRVLIRDDRYNSVVNLKPWLSSNNATVYYVLATPTNTEITDTELKEDLEAISNIALFEGVNNISMESSNLTSSFKVYYDTWYEFDKILRNGYNIREDRDRITQKFANGHRKQFVSDYVDCSITLNLDTIDKDTTQDYLQRLKSGAYKYYSIDGKEYRTAQFIIENKPELSVENSISNNVDVNEYQITLLKAGD